MDEMANSAGALDEAYSVYLSSAEAHINQFKAAYEGLARSAVETGLVNFFVDAGTAILNFAAGLQEVGALMPILATIGGLLGASGNPAGWVLLVVSTLGEIAQIVQAIEDAIPSLEKVNEEFGKLEAKTTDLGKTASNLRTAQTDIIPRFAELAKGVDSVGRNLTLTDEEYSEFLNLNNQLAQLLPDNVAYYNENGDAVLDLAYNTDTLSESLNRLVEAQLAATQASFGQTLQEYIDLVDQAKTLNQGAIDDAQRMIDTLNALLSGESVSFGFGLSGQNAAEGLKKILDRNGIKSQLSQGLSGFAISVDAIDESAREAVRHYIDVLELQISEAEGRVQAAWDRLTPAMKGWLQSDVLFQELPDQARQAAIAMVNAMDPQTLGLDSSDAIKTYITNNIIQPLYSYGPQISDAFAQAMSFEEAFQKGEISAEEYAEKVRLAMLSLWAVMGEDFVPMMNSLGYEGSYFNEVLDNMTSAMGGVETAADSAGASLKDAFDAKELQTAVSTLKSAFDDLGKEGSTGVVYSNLEKIREAFGTSVPNIDEYINRIISAGTNTEAVTGIFNELINAKVTDIARTQDLTSANEAQIASMLREIGVVNADQAAHELMRQAKLEEVAALLDVADASQYTAQELYDLMLTEIQANNTGMTFSQQIDALRKLAEAAGIAAGSIRSLQTVQDSLVFDESGMIDVAASNKNRARADEHNAVANSIKEIREAFSGLGTSLPQTTIDFGGFATAATGAGSAAKEAAESAEEAAKAIDTLGSAVSNLKSFYDIVAQARDEMHDGGLGVETLRALAEAGNEYVNYLRIENGQIMLNAEAYESYLITTVQNAMYAVQQETDTLKNETAELIARRTELEATGISNDTVTSQIEELTTKINENSNAIVSNQMQLITYGMELDTITAKTNAYAQALEGFEDTASVITDTSKTMRTLYDLQTMVADGYKHDIDAVLEFAEVYPEILNYAQATADGQILLNEEVVTSFINAKQAEMQAAIQERIADLEADNITLEAKKEFLRMQLELIKLLAQGDSAMTAETAAYKIKVATEVAQTLIKMGVTEAVAYEAASNVMIQDTQAFQGSVEDAATAIVTDITNGSAGAAQNLGANAAVMIQAMGGVQAAAQATGDALANIGAEHATPTTVVDPSEYIDYHVRTTEENTLDTLGAAKDLANALEGTEYNLAALTADIEAQISNIDMAIAQNQGQIAALQALANKPLSSYAQKTAASTSSEIVDKVKEDVAETEDWFKTLYTLHNHLVEMNQETDKEYLDWLSVAYRQALKEGILSLDDFFRYQEELYRGYMNLFKEYLSDTEHEISVRSNFEGESQKIIELYRVMIADIEREIREYREMGLDDTDEYIQDLQDKWLSYRDKLADYEEDISKNAKDALDDLVQLRVDMLKDDLESEKKNLDERLSNLKSFYDKQKDMLKEQYDTEKYLDEQAERRRKVSQLRSQLEQLSYDDSAWAQRRRAELQQEIGDAQKDLDDFEREHALEVAQNDLDKILEQQQKEIEAQTSLLEEQVQKADDLYQVALEEIKNGSIDLYEEMVSWNELYGDGIEDTIKKAWEEAYKALAEYKALYGSLYQDVNLGNATGYTGEGSYNDSVIGREYTPPTPTAAPELRNGNLITVKSTATHYSKKSGYNLISPDIPGGSFLIYNTDGDEVLIGRDGKRIGWISKYDIEGYASGTGNASRGWHRIDERGSETIFESKNGSKYRMFTGGEMVLNARQSRFLYNFAKEHAKIGGYASKGLLKPPDAEITPPPKKYDINIGGITIQGNADKATVSEIRRAQRDNLDTMLREINKLNK